MKKKSQIKYVRALHSTELGKFFDGLKQASKLKTPEAFVARLRKVIDALPTRHPKDVVGKNSIGTEYFIVR